MSQPDDRLRIALPSHNENAAINDTTTDEPSWAALGWTALGPYHSERSLREGALVLTSMDITHELMRGASGGFLLVRNGDYDRARKQLDRYEEENRDFPPRRRVERPRYSGPPLVLLAFVALVAFAWITGPVSRPHGSWFAQGASVSSLVLGSEPYRAVTALTLHADGAHVLSNLVSGAIFGRAVERRFGPGVALLGITASGFLGNVANAAFYAGQGLPHASIGASTAVFGAVGLLVTSQLLLGGTRWFGSSSGKKERRHWTEYLAPVVGGLALLGALGSGPSTDIWAHAFGLLSGVVIALPLALWLRRADWQKRVSVWAQASTAALALSVIGVSWAAAYVL